VNLFGMVRFAEVFSDPKIVQTLSEQLGWSHIVEFGENPPIGLILCADKSAEHVELLQLEKSGIRVAQYLTELPPRKVLEHKLHEAIRIAREQLATRQLPPAGGVSDLAQMEPKMS